MTEVDYEGATSFVALVRSIRSWHREAEWPDYLVAHINMVEAAEPWLPDGIVVLEWPDGPSSAAPCSVVLGRRA